MLLAFSGFDKISVWTKWGRIWKSLIQQACFSDRHYMVRLDQRIDQFKSFVDAESICVIVQAVWQDDGTEALEKEHRHNIM